MSEITVTQNAEQHRYEAHLDGEVAGFAAYQLGDDVVVFTHTEVDDAHEGKGVGSSLVRGALDDVRSKGGHKVLARCPFVASWIDKHPDYADLLA
ncbi:GNAT family N-acetyltransferase [Ornithinimicrobium sufpigmenti]|uniref:GNAT family N-acetyltransferase n=1 Tax=Ornithinimicrobium sufpigmenti TaxID=2508882 RepID=UPI00103554C3|nr:MULTISPECIES: GNAT family N-acetyltransferase [unclassified Ornithinimicrobium]